MANPKRRLGPLAGGGFLGAGLRRDGSMGRIYWTRSERPTAAGAYDGHVVTVIAWRCPACRSAMKTSLPRFGGRLSSKTRAFPALCATCGTARMLDVAQNQPLVDVTTEAVKDS